MSAAGAAAPTVSVILPTFQRRDLLVRAVTSVRDQTFRDFELIVVDDGSTDGTGEALAPLLSPSLLYRWQENRGVSAARNHALRLARGSIVAFLDSDDRWLPDHLAVVVAVLERQPEAVLVSTNPGLVVGGKGRVADARLVDPLPRHLLGNMVGYPSGVAVRSEALRSVGGFDEGLVTGEDRDLYVRLALRGPFSTLGRRTMVRGYSSKSLSHWARPRGHSLETSEVIVERTLESLDGRGELASAADGTRMFVKALRALDRRDDRAVERALAEACDRFPALSREPEMVEHRVRFLPRSHEPQERLRHLTTAASLWPDQRSDTALFLRLMAIGTALRTGRPLRAAGLLAGWPLRRTAGFAVRGMRPAARHLQRKLDARLHRLVESPAEAIGSRT